MNIQGDSFIIRNIRSILGIIAIIAPYGILFDQYLFELNSIPISLYIAPTEVSWQLNFTNPISIIAIVIRVAALKIAFNYFDGLSSIKRTIYLILLSELITVFYAVVISFPVLFIPDFIYLIFGVPTPFFLITFLYCHRAIPEEDEYTWLES